MTLLTSAAPTDVAGVLTGDALAFLAELHRRFDEPRRELLRRRDERQAAFARGELPSLSESAASRDPGWRVPAAPEDLHDRRVEITGPTDRKMMINAMNSGAKVFMADLEDANSPTWANMVQGQANLADAVRRRIEFRAADGRAYALVHESATLVVRPRGWHLEERHVEVDRRPVSASLFDFGLYAFHNAHELLARGSGPYFYLPKLQGHLEARLWNDVMGWAEERLGLDHGVMRATVLIEHILAALEMDEILYELRHRATGLNAGRWDYIFSVVKCFGDRPEFVLPDRGQVTMRVPFMSAYAEALVRACHRRGAHAIGGMAALIPSRRDHAANESALAGVRADKEREAAAGFDGTWVAHPDLVPVAREVFDRALGDAPDQLDVTRADVRPSARRLLDVAVPDGRITQAGVRANVAVCLAYVESWLRGTGAVAIHGLMEDTATAEISRVQLWQWMRHAVHAEDLGPVSAEAVRRILDEETAVLARRLGEESRLEDARALVERLVLSPDLPEFLTVAGAELLD